MASISKHLLLFSFLSLFELFGFCQGRQLTALPDQKAAAGGTQCLQKLIPCQAYLKAPEKAPPTCCSPLKKLVSDDAECLCTLFSNKDMLSSLNITQADALKLSKACGANADISACKKDAAASPGTSPSNSSSSSGNSPGGTESAAYAPSAPGRSGFAAVVMALIIAAF